MAKRSGPGGRREREAFECGYVAALTQIREDDERMLTVAALGALAERMAQPHEAARLAWEARRP